jgi:hypothetical protein
MCIFTVSFILGFVLLILAACGLAGVFNENLFLAKIFLLGLSSLVLVEIGCICLVYSYKHEILTHANTLFKSFISRYAEDADIRYLVDTIQSDLKCCGISSPSDWDLNPYYRCSSLVSTYACSVPASCCYNFSNDKPKFNLFCGHGIRRNDSISKSNAYQLIHVSGCKYSIYTLLDYKHTLASYILAGVLIPQLMGIFLIISFLVSLNFLITYGSIEYQSHHLSSSDPNDQTSNSASLEIAITKSTHSMSNINKDIFFVNKKDNYLVTFDHDLKKKQFQTYKKRLEPLPQNDTKKNLFILSIGSNNDFLKRIQIKNKDKE